MLMKLLKYDCKSLGRILFPAYILLFVLAAIARITGFLASEYALNTIFIFASSASHVILVAAIMLLLVGSLIASILRFRNNLLKDEGYLMHTLPVSVTMLYYSKLFMTILFMVAGMILSYFAWAFAVWDINYFSPITEQVKASGVDNPFIWPLLAIYMVIAFVSAISQIFVSLSIGNTLKGNRDLMSFVVFFITYLIGQAAGAITLLLTFISEPTIINMLDSNMMPVEIFIRIFGIMAVFLFVLAGTYQFLSIRFLRAKLNLE